MKKWCLMIMVSFLVVFSGCKKDVEEEIVETKMKLVDKLEKLDVPEVMRNSSNANAQQAVGYVDQVKAIEGYFEWFDMPEDAVHEKSMALSGGDTYFWTDGGVSIWETYTEEGTKHIWSIDIDNGTGAGRQPYIVSEEEKDGSKGSMKIYNFGIKSSNWLFAYEWGFDSKDNASLIWKDYEESFVYEIKSNADLSGYAKYWITGALLYDFSWNTDGSGSYKFLGSDGSVILSESWTVADL